MASKLKQAVNFETNREFTREETNRLNEILNKQLGPEYISKRPSGGGPVSYIEGWKALNLANHVFGFNGWSSEIKNTSVDYVDDHGGNGRYSVGLSVVIRITLKDGTYHEDLGYGSVDRAKGRAAAFEKCKKQAITDAMKRCLRCFGNVLGNCLYDKDFLKYVNKVTLAPPEYTESDLLRHPDIVKINRLKYSERNDFNGPGPINVNAQPAGGGGGIGNGNGNNVNGARQQRSPHQRSTSSSGSRKQSAPIAKKDDVLTESMFDDSMEDVFEDDNHYNDIDEYELALIDANVDDIGGSAASAASAASTANTAAKSDDSRNRSDTTPNINRTDGQGVPSSVSFFSAKAAQEVQNNAGLVPTGKQFNINHQSSSLKRILDQSKSTPVKRVGIQQHPVYPKSSQQSSSNLMKRQSPVPWQTNNSTNKQRRVLNGLPTHAE